MANALCRLVAHPLAVVAHVLGKPLRATPLTFDEIGWIVLRPRPHRRPASELWRDLDHRLADEHRDRIEIAGVALQPQPLRLQRQCATAGEGVMEGGKLPPVEQLFGPRMVGVLSAGAPPGLPDLVARCLQHRLVGGVLPQHQILDDAE